MMIDPLAVLAGLLGLTVGSFVNVVIVRLPAGRGLWGPHSVCRATGAAAFRRRPSRSSSGGT